MASCTIQTQISEQYLVKLAEEELDHFERSEDPRERERTLHNAYAFLYRHIPPVFNAVAEPLRLRFLGLVANPQHKEDAKFCDTYLSTYE